MRDTGSHISGVAGRYANSLFELAVESKAIDAVADDLERFEELLEGSADLRRLVTSPVFSADEQMRAIGKIADAAAIKGIVGNFLRVVARNRRLFAVPGMIQAFREMVADHRGEAVADVISAHELSESQKKELADTLKTVAAKNVSMKISVDPSLLGGLIVKIGSRQIDTSLKTKLNSLKLALKEVG